MTHRPKVPQLRRCSTFTGSISSLRTSTSPSRRCSLGVRFADLPSQHLRSPTSGRRPSTEDGTDDGFKSFPKSQHRQAIRYPPVSRTRSMPDPVRHTRRSTVASGASMSILANAGDKCLDRRSSRRISIAHIKKAIIHSGSSEMNSTIRKANDSGRRNFPRSTSFEPFSSHSSIERPRSFDYHRGLLPPVTARGDMKALKLSLKTRLLEAKTGLDLRRKKREPTVPSPRTKEAQKARSDIAIFEKSLEKHRADLRRRSLFGNRN
mmetsp:Transcript_12633/g.24161  ORF Transcript_12633/g.24161 Transcript_12633/m.24161 type:complete len:264 (+) Transcript_12633:38-829(+)